MNKPTLVVLAAGMGSRFGGCKQITPVDDEGHVIIDYSIFDAVRAGFGKVVCIIKHEMEEDFRAAIGDRIAPYVDLQYAYQSIDMLPKGFSVPEGRTKPWGTAHAILCAKDVIDTDFAVVNADDFYGRTAFAAAHDFLAAPHAENAHAMVGYAIEKTLTENGTVSRGICVTDENNLLTEIKERTKIAPREGGAAFTEDDGATWTFVPAGTPVSLNLWAFRRGILDEFEARFPEFLTNNVPKNPMKAEYFLPSIPDALIREGKGTVEVLKTNERWFGVTYKEDLQLFRETLKQLKQEGVYTKELWK